MQLGEQLTDFGVTGLFGQQLIENGFCPGKLPCFNTAGGFRQQIERLGVLRRTSSRRSSCIASAARIPTGLCEMFDELSGLAIGRFDPQDGLIRILRLSISLLGRSLPS